jgi:KEOPS complex subunit Cgi121
MKLLAGTVDIDDVDAFVERLAGVAADHGVTVQAFDARYVVDRAHLERAVELADRAIARGENVADDHAVEILLYAAGRRQINRAFEMGVSEGEHPVVVLADDPGADPDGADPDDVGPDDTDPADGPTEGIDSETRAVAALRESLAIDADESVLGDYDPERVRDFFEVTEVELAAVEGGLPDLVRERVALLDVEK